EGTHYFGWQKTSTGPSVEETLETVLSQILQEPCQLQAASRTDAGVHANGQIVNFKTNHPRISKISQLLVSINSLLPKDIRVLTIDIVNEEFHPTLDCIGKEYHYHVCFG